MYQSRNIGSIPKDKRSSQFIFFIRNHFSNLTRAITTSIFTAPFVVIVLLNYWIIPYGISTSLFIDNGPPFVSNFLAHIFLDQNLQRRKPIISENWNKERYNNTIMAIIRHYIN